MEGSYSDKYSFVGEWYDQQASLIRRFNVFFYPLDETLEMFDLHTRKMFVRRIKVKGITLDKFYIGGTLYIFGRLVKITDFGCDNTRKKLQSDMQVTFAFLKPISIKLCGTIIKTLNEYGLRVTKMKKARCNSDDLNFLYRESVTDPTYPFILEYLNGNPLIGLELLGKNAVDLSKKVVGHNDPLKAESGTIRALYGTDSVHNCIHISSSFERAAEDLEYFFPPPPIKAMRLGLTATLSNCTLCIVKPHAIREGKLGTALEMIEEGGFDVTALNMFIVDVVNATEFFEVYKGIVPEFKGMVEELSSGSCVAMEIVSKDKSLNTAVEFRKIVGPSDPEIARLLRPNTLRAKLGNTKVQNAIHCSDLPEDGLLEVEYFFKILDL